MKIAKAYTTANHNVITKLGGRFAPFFATLVLVHVLLAGDSLAEYSKVEVGTLVCSVKDKSGYVFGSTRNLSCQLESLAPGRDNQKYQGTITKFGRDAGIAGQVQLTWIVLARSLDINFGALSGQYVGVDQPVGASSELDEKVLIGGRDNSVSLQPLSVRGVNGINVAATVSSLKLKYQGRGATIRRPLAHTLCGTVVRFAKGDTLYGIAGRCGTTVDGLLEANPDIKNVSKIPAGTKIRVPAYPLRSDNKRCGTHAITTANESIGSVARRCGVSVGALVDANPLLTTLGPYNAGKTINIPPNISTSTRRNCGPFIRFGAQDTKTGTLKSIAELCGTTVDAILELNPKITNLKKIKKGRKIRVPSFRTTTRSIGCGSHAIAKKSESVLTIAKRCNVSVGALLDANPAIRTFSNLQPGQVVNVPPYGTVSSRI